MKYFTTICSVGIVCLFGFFPYVADAQLVTCAGTEAAGGECNFCTFAQMVKKIVDFITTILILISVIMIAVTGVQMTYTAAGNGDALSLLKDRMTNIIIGFFLIIAAWTLVDTLIKVLVANTTDNAAIMDWRTFGTSLDKLCGDVNEPVEKNLHAVDPANPAQQSAAPLTLNPVENCPGCVTFGEGITCKNNCSADASVAAPLSEVAAASEFAFEVTEGFPPVRKHQADCHSNGTCVDIVTQDRALLGDYDNVIQIQNEIKSKGCRAVFEPSSSGSCPAGTYTPGAGKANTCLPHSVTKSTGNHFSMYCD